MLGVVAWWYIRQGDDLPFTDHLLIDFADYILLDLSGDRILLG